MAVCTGVSAAAGGLLTGRTRPHGSSRRRAPRHNGRAAEAALERALRVGIDLTAILPVRTGVDTCLEQLVLALGTIDSQSQYTVLVNREDRALFDGRLPDNFRVVARCLRPRPVRLLFQQLLLPALARASRLDVVHSPSFIMPLARGRQRHLLTVYDMTSFTLPQCHEPLRRSFAYRQAVLASLRRANLVTVPSQATRRAVLERAGDIDPAKVRVVPLGIDERFTPRGDEEVGALLTRHGLLRPYVLFLGTLEPRKNLVRLVAAFARLVAAGLDLDLVLAGRPGWGCGPLATAIEEHRVHDRVHRLDYVDDRELPVLLSGATLLAYPSLEEGFGLPPLEAMACGAPVVASDTAALAENLTGAAELVPPADVEALAAAMQRLVTDAALRQERRRQGLERAASFHWRRTAEETFACYRELAGAQDQA